MFSDLKEDALGHVQQSFSHLPKDAEKRYTVVPSLPLVLFDTAMQGGAGTKARGRGAPLALRLWVEALLSVPPKERAGPTRLRVKLRDLVAALWPGGWGGPARDGQKLREALWRVHNAMLPWTGGLWVAVRVVNYPSMRDRNSALVLDVELPPGSGVGPMVHRPTLRQFGVEDGYAYRLWLGLAYLWNHYLTHGGKRLPATVPVVERAHNGGLLGSDGKPLQDKVGQPVTHWSDKRAVRTGAFIRNAELERLPWLTSSDLIELGAPEHETGDRRLRHKTKKRVLEALEWMSKAGTLVLVKGETSGLRRIEPPDWWGDPEGGPPRPDDKNPRPDDKNPRPDDKNPRPDDKNPRPDDGASPQPANILRFPAPPRLPR